jgi:hypothetical protein
MSVKVKNGPDALEMGCLYYLPKADIGSATLPIATVIACYGGAKLTGAHFQKPGSAARCYITRADTRKFG